LKLIPDRGLDRIRNGIGVEPALVGVGHDFEGVSGVTVSHQPLAVGQEKLLETEAIPLHGVDQLVEVHGFALLAFPIDKICVAVGDAGKLS